jgi:hypothetical protein
VTASAAGLAANSVTSTVAVVALRRSLQAVATATTTVSDDGTSASTVAGVYGSVALKVRELDLDTGQPIAGDTISFTLPAAASARWSSGTDLIALAQTGPGGQARAYLVTTANAEGPWNVVAQSTAGGPAVTFTVTIQGGGSCTVNAQCPPGQVCSGDPPRCQPGGPGCGSCPPPCDGAGCVPHETVPDVSGWWYTRHDFAISEAIPLAVREVFKGIRLIDQTLLGKLTIPGLPRWVQAVLDSWVSRLLQQYLPGWLQELVHLADDLATILGNLRSEGSLRLTRNGDAAHLEGEEIWTSLVFYWLPLCNGDISGDPAEPPECARIDVLTTDSGATDETAQCKGQLLPAISVRAAPFTASVARKGDAWVLDVDQRQVKLEMGKIVLILVDQLIALVSGGEYHCIDEVTACPPGGPCLVDCTGLGADIDGATDGIVDSGTVEALCSGAVRAWGQIWMEGLARMWPVGADTLDFSGSATISGHTDDANCDEGAVPDTCGARLGNARWDADLNSGDPAVRERRDGSWSGDFFFRLVHPLPGAWRGTRFE